MTNTAVFPKYITEDLMNPPHIVRQLVAMIRDEQPDSSIQQDVWDHLIGCIACQTVLERYLRDVVAYNKEHGEPEEPALELLTKLGAIMHTTLKQDIPAYAETLEDQGVAAADSRFPQFADHVRTCKSCQSAVKDLHEWLQYSER